MREILEKTKKIINERCANHVYDLAELVDLGFEKKDLLVPSSARLINDEYLIENEDKSKKIILCHTCHDPSGPFQNIPDIHKFSIEYYENEVKVDSVSDEFSK